MPKKTVSKTTKIRSPKGSVYTVDDSGNVFEQSEDAPKVKKSGNLSTPGQLVARINADQLRLGVSPGQHAARINMGQHGARINSDSEDR